jgi:hypothetical protein
MENSLPKPCNPPPYPTNPRMQLGQRRHHNPTNNTNTPLLPKSIITHDIFYQLSHSKINMAMGKIFTISTHNMPHPLPSYPRLCFKNDITNQPIHKITSKKGTQSHPYNSQLLHITTNNSRQPRTNLPTNTLAHL